MEKVVSAGSIENDLVKAIEVLAPLVLPQGCLCFAGARQLGTPHNAPFA